MIQLEQAPQQETQPTPMVKNEVRGGGIIIAITIIGVWMCSLFLLLSLDVSHLPTLALLPAMFWQIFLYTGLFITAHDAMHGSVFPQNHKINQLVGTVAIFIYALFSYDKLLKKHWLHHHHPASELDPDFHDGRHTNFFSWYFHFLKSYWSWKQAIGLMVIFYIMNYQLHIPAVNLTLFWVIPSFLSSVQLFYFGSFLPHQEPEGGYINPHRAQTSQRPVFWSFITCYHFGYHEEHHKYPHVPWWKLPAIYKKRARG